MSNELIGFLAAAKVKVTDQLTTAFNSMGIVGVDDFDDLDEEMTTALEGAMKPMEKKRFRKSLVGRKEGAKGNAGTKILPHNSGQYTGEMADGDANGNGTCVWLEGSKYYGDTYVGNYTADKMDGYGTYTWACGDKYVGEWKNDKKHGQGTDTNANGTIKHSGEWVNDKPKK